MGTRRVSGRVAAAALMVTVLLAGTIGLGVNAFIHHSGQPTPLPTPNATVALPTPTPLTPAILGVAPTISSGIGTAPAATSPVNSPPSVSTATPVAFDPEHLSATVGPAVVTISNRQQSPTNSGVTREANAGSGVIYDTQGYILTNRHVIDGAETIEVSVQGGKTIVGMLVGQDPVADIAVVKIDPADVPAVAPFGDSSLVRSGQRVIVIGSPLQFAGSVTRGIISGTDRSISGMDGMMQTDAPISPGSSGGPLVNARGEVIGIATGTIRTNQAERIGFAIPSNYARRLAGIIVADGKVTRPYLGITTELLTPASGEELKVNVGHGAYVSDVSPNTPAAKAGIQKRDVILAINTAKVDHTTPLAVILLDFKPGETVSVTINRDGAEQQIPVTLTERPASLDP